MKCRQYGQVLIIYLTTLFIGGSSLVLGVVATGKDTNELEKSVKATITDAGHRSEALELLSQWEKQGKVVNEQYMNQRKHLAALIQDYSSKKRQFNSARDGILLMDKTTSKQLLDIQYALRKTMTRKEWDNIFSAD